MISNQLIESIENAPQRQHVKLSRKYIHLQKIPVHWLNVFGQNPRKFDGATIGYEEDHEGNLKVSIVTKHPNDCYSKKIGRELANSALDNAMKKTAQTLWSKSESGFVVTIPKEEIFARVPVVQEVLQINDIKNIFLKVEIVLPIVTDFFNAAVAEKKITNQAEQTWIPDLV